MSLSVLSAEHFVERNEITILDMDIVGIEFIRCFHATRLPTKDSILTKGIRVPTGDSFLETLSMVGIKDASLQRIQLILNTGERVNRQLAYFHLNYDFLRVNCDFRRHGSELVREYVSAVCPERWNYVLRRVAKWKPYVFQMLIPVAYFKNDPLWMDLCGDARMDMLSQGIEEVDITMQSDLDVPPIYIEHIFENM